MLLKVGDIAPEITLADQDGTTRSLSQYKGQWVLVYFYPKDNTPGCTTEACSLRDSFPTFDKHTCVVLGVSTDSVASHKKFARKFNLPFILLADTEKKTVADYGVWGEKKFMGRTYIGTARTSFLINPQGIIYKVYEKVNPVTHAKEVLADITQGKQ